MTIKSHIILFSIIGGSLIGCQFKANETSDKTAETKEPVCVSDTSFDSVEQPDKQEKTAAWRGSGKATLYFVGDAMQHRPQLWNAKNIGQNGEYDFSNYYTLLQPVIESADYAVVNLETPLGGGGDYSGYPRFSAPDSYAAALKDAGFDLFLTANNHILDRGDYGLRRTLNVLDSLNVDNIGVYRDQEERTLRTPFIKDINGIKFGFLNYTYGTNGLSPREGSDIGYINKEKMAQEIEKTKENGAEMIVVCIHWGNEYVLNENAVQRNLAQFMLDRGVDIIIGSHPHVVQPMQMIDNPATGRKALVVYSLGNFISNFDKPNCLGGLSVLCTVERNENGIPELKETVYDTFFTGKPSNLTKSYRVVPSSMVNEMLTEAQKRDWEFFNKNAEELFAKYNKGVRKASP